MNGYVKCVDLQIMGQKHHVVNVILLIPNDK